MKLTDENLPEQDKISFLLPNGERIIDKMTYSYDTSELEESEYQITIFGADKAGNLISKDIIFTIYHTIVEIPQQSLDMNKIISGIIIAIITGTVFSLRKRKLVLNQ